MSEQRIDLDILIVGGGPGGLAAAIYAARARRKTLVIDKVYPGGQLMYTAHIENYPGFPKGAAGMELAAQMVEQVKNFGVEIRTEEAGELFSDDSRIIVKTDKSEIRAGTAIIAAGASWRKLDVPGEKKLSGKGVSYCATCDGMLYRDREVVVVGGGDTAICEALFLTRFASKVSVVHRRDALRAEKIVQERAFENDRINFIWNSVVTEILGKDKVEGIRLQNKKSGEESSFDTDGVFIFIGNIPNTEFLPPDIEKNDQGQIVTNQKMESSMPGLYAVGDIRAGSIRQVISAAGDGATAAWYADKYLDALEQAPH